MLSPKNIVIVGGNSAGPAAAAKAKRYSPDSNVIMFEAGDFISTGTCELPYVLSNEIKSFNEVVFFTPESFEKEKSVKVLTNHFVERIDRKNKLITVKSLKSNQTYNQNYDKLILATGSRSKTIAGLNANLKNVFHLKSVKNIIELKEYLGTSTHKNTMIIGSGYIGIESAEAFKANGHNVIMLDKEKLPMPGTEIEIQHLVMDLLKKEKIEFYGNVIDPKFIIKDNEVRGVVIERRTIEVDLILVAVGFEPNNDLAITAKLEIGKYGGIKINQRLQTSDPNIFAAGDNIEVINKITNRSEYIPLATYSHQYGHIAGENAAGGNSIAKPVVKNIAVRIFNKNLCIIGLNSHEAQENRFSFSSVASIVPNLIKVMPGSENVFGKIIFEKSSKRILGASFFGGRETIGYSDLIASFINNKIPAVELANINYNYNPPLSPFVNLLSTLGRKAEKEKL